jgi:DNA polymerase III delta prime subunit
MTEFENKYAPKTLNEVVFPSVQSERLVKAYVNQKGLMRPLLLHGPNGTGKTSIAQLLPYAIAPAVGVEGDDNFVPVVSKFDIKIYRCAKMNNVSEFMKKVENFAGNICWNSANMRFMILDEVDNLTNDIQAMLKGVIEECRKTTLFIQTTNHLEKLDKGLVDRSEEVEIGNATPPLWLPRMKRILELEKVPERNSKVLANMAARANGSPRKILQDLQDLVSQLRSKPPSRPKAVVIPIKKSRKTK